MQVVKEEKPTNLTLKQLIRKVHLAQPAEQVMSIVGKKYPSSAEDFKKTGLSGEWDAQRAGKRMKLPTPETWETLLSAKGNKHTTWQELLDHKKLPIMAMLRNLRNMIITGISPEHHDLVLNRLTDEKTIISSRQLPWRFLSAYEAINVDLEKLMNDILDNDGSDEKIIQVQVKGKKGRAMGATRTIKKKVIIPVNMPDVPLIEKYRSAIDTAIRISTMHNIKPIEGRTVVFCDVSGSMKCPCTSRGNLGSLQQVIDVAILLGLMLQDVCEECDFRIFSSPGAKDKNRCDISVPLEPNTILNNIKRVHKYAEQLGGGTDFPYDYITELTRQNKKIDNFIILSDMMIAPGKNEMAARGTNVTTALRNYRNAVNPDLLFVTIDLYGSGKSIVDVNEGANPKDVLVTGFSDNILRFIAERGNHKQLAYIQSIDETKKVGKPKNAKKSAEKPVKKDDNGKMEV
jgi:telomerase protein component 1